MPDAQAFRPLRTRTPRVTKLADVPKISTWPSPPTEKFDSVTQELFLKNRLAVELYVGHSMAADIKKRTGYEISKARKLTEKCMRINPKTQGMVGLWACIPGRRLPGETHTRKAPIDPTLAEKGQGLKGTLKRLFDERPLIESDMTHFIKNRCLPGQPQLSILGFKIVVDTFHVVCRRHGVRPDEWPFNTKRQGENAINVWWRKTRANFPLQTILHVHGAEAHKLALVDMSGIRSMRKPLVFAAYERAETDEHLIHGSCSIGFPNRKGGISWVKTTRIWGLAMRDKRTGAVLSSCVSYREKYDANDVLTLIIRAIFPPPRRALSFKHPEYRYAHNAAYPAELEAFRANTWRELAWDGDSCHLSLADKGRVEEVIGCNIKFEKIGEPVARESIEGLFAKFAREFQILPTGTGSQPRDPSRRDPENAAKNLQLYAHHVDEIWDVLCRNLNCQPATECGGASPLQFLDELREKGEAFVSPLGELGPNNLHKLLPCYDATVTHRRGAHGVLRVCLFGASYSSNALTFNKELSYAANLNVKIYVEADARCAFVVPDALPDMCFPVEVIDKDLKEFPHPLIWRQLAEAATTNTVAAGQAARPSVMLGVVGALGEAAQNNQPGAAAHLAHSASFMANFGAGSLGYVMTPDERHKLDVGVQGLFAEPSEILDDSEFEDAPNAGPREAVCEPAVTSVPASASVEPPPAVDSDPF